MSRRTFIIFILAVFSTLQLTANTVDNKAISLPQGTVEGVLGNGFHYIIKSNSRPRHAVEMRLLVHAGSLQENEAQKGCAHFMEHIAFDGTAHYPGNAWIDFFERIGMKRGPDFNAYADYDHTTYWLSLPVADMGYHVMNSTLLALRDILECITFDTQQIEKERRSIIDELHGYTPDDVFLPLKNGKGKYANHSPLGKENDFQTLSRENLIKFYKKWYLPHNACLVVVGDIDVEDMKKRIQTIFNEIPSGLPNATTGKNTLNYKKGTTLYEVRGKTGDSQLEFIIPHPHVVANDLTSGVRKEQLALLVSSLNKRMAEQGIQGTIKNTWYEADKDHFTITVEGNNKKLLKKRMNRVLALLGKISKHGFYKQEIADRAAQMSESLEADTTGMTSAHWCDRFNEYVIKGERQVYDSAELAYVKEKVKTTDNAQIQNILSDILAKGKETLLVAYRNHVGATETFNEKELHNIYKSGLSAHLSGFTYTPKHADKKILPANIPLCLRASHADAMNKVNTVNCYDDIAAQEYILDNGLKIILRPTNEKDSTLHLAIIGRGGTSDLDKKSYPLLQDAANLVDMGGLAHLSVDSLLEVMHDADLTLSVRTGQYWHKLRASAPVKMAQVLMNLVYEKITAPGRAYEAFESVRSQLAQNLDSEQRLTPLFEQDSDQKMLHKIDSLCCNIPPTSRNLVKKDLDKFNLDDITDYYISLFSNPQRKTLILTGNFQSEPIINMAVATFARLQHTKEMGSIIDTPSPMPQTPYREFFANDSAKQLVLNYIFPGNYEPGLRKTVLMQLMRSILQSRITNVLRDKMDISQDSFAAVSYKGDPQKNYYFWLTINIKDENRDKATQAIEDIVKDLQNHPVSEADLKKLKMSFLVSKRKELTDDVPTEWENTFVTLIQNHESLEELNGFTQQLQSISAEDVRQGFNNYLRFDRMSLLSKGKPFNNKDERK